MNSITGEPEPGVHDPSSQNEPGNQSQIKNDLRIIDIFSDGQAPLNNLPPASPELQRSLLQNLRKLVFDSGGNEALRKMSDALRQGVAREDIRTGKIFESGNFAGWTILRNLAYGAHSDVYLGLDDEGNKVIIKAGKELPDEDPGSAAIRIERQARAVQHIGIILRDADRFQGQVPAFLNIDLVHYGAPVYAESYVEMRGEESRPLSEVLAHPKKYHYSQVMHLLTQITEISFLVDEEENNTSPVKMSRVPNSLKINDPSNYVIALEPDRRDDTIIVNPVTLELASLIDFSDPGYPIQLIRDDPKLVRENKRKSVISLGKMMQSMCDMSQTPETFSSLLQRMSNGEMSDFASVYKELSTPRERI